jgi:hypothetical protein
MNDSGAESELTHGPARGSVRQVALGCGAAAAGTMGRLRSAAAVGWSGGAGRGRFMASSWLRGRNHSIGPWRESVSRSNLSLAPKALPITEDEIKPRRSVSKAVPNGDEIKPPRAVEAR